MPNIRTNAPDMPNDKEGRTRCMKIQERQVGGGHPRRNYFGTSRRRVETAYLRATQTPPRPKIVATDTGLAGQMQKRYKAQNYPRPPNSRIALSLK